MILVLIALAIATILSLSFLSSQATTHGVSQNLQDHAQARSVAESALVSAIHYVQSDSDFRTDKTHGQWASGASLNGGTFDLYGYDGIDTDGDGVVDDTDGDLADDANDYVTITAVGYFDGVSHTVHAVVTPGEQTNAGTVLYVVDSGGPNTYEQTRIDLIESWGFDVVQIGESESQTNYNTAITDNNVTAVYVSTLTDNDAGPKLADASIGVVTEEGSSYDDLLLSTGQGGYTSTDIDITDNSHYITEPFATGTLTIASANSSFKRLSGTIGAGLQTLAERPGSSSTVLSVLDTGDIGHDGSSSPGRRVALPWSGNSNQWNINADGETIMQRSLVWASVDGGSSGGTYDYATRTQSTDIWAYDGQSSDDPPTNSTTPSSELSPTEYDDIEADDSGSHTYSVTQNGRYALLRCVIQIDQDEADVARLDATVTGQNTNAHGPRTDGVELMIWNYATDSYEQLAISADTESEVTVEGGVSSNLADYLGGGSDDTVTLLVRSSDKRSANKDNILSIDYVSLAVTIGVSGSGPQLVALYEFQEVPSPAPALVGHWELNDTAGGGGGAYDFNNGSQGSDVWAYDGQSSTAPPSSNSTPSTALNWSEYDDIEDDDSDSHGYNTSSNNRRSMMRYVIEIDEDEGTVSQIDVTWIGSNYNEHHSRTDGVELYIWNYNSGNYEQLDVSADTESEVTLNGSVVSNLPDYIDDGSDNKVTILAQSRDKQTGGRDNRLYCDYISLAINSGVIADDEVASIDGVASGGVSGGVSGNGDGGTAFAFDGFDGYVEVAHDDAYLLDDGSLSFWFNADDLTGHHGLISKDSNDFDTGGHLHVYTDGSALKARIQDTDSSYTLTSSGLSIGTWYHVVVSWGAGGFKLFRNGVEQDTDPYVGGLGSNSGDIGNYETMVIGASTWSSDDIVATPITYPFEGRIDDVRIFDSGFNSDQADNVYNGLDPGAGDATIVYDTSNYGTALDLDIQNFDNVSWVSGGGLTIDSATRISSPAAATKLYDALTATNQMSIELDYTPANNTQSGPAKIATFSGGASSTNFTVGQIGNAYTARLRTDTTTSNGTPSADSSAVLAADTREHLILSYDGENVTLYRNGVADVTLARTGDLNWDSTFGFILGNEATDGYDWLGTLHRVAIYDQAFNATQAGNVFGGGEPGDGATAGAGDVDWVEP